MKCILHIGLEKTGTSSIQAFLNGHREAISSSGYYVLKGLGNAFHRELVSCAMDTSVFDDMHQLYDIRTQRERYEFDQKILRRVGDEISGLSDQTSSVIISSEHFSSRLKTKAEISCLKKILDAWFDEYSVVVYLRPQVDLARSLYSTALKFGETKSFRDFMHYQLGGRRDAYYDYASICRNWRDIFGDGLLNVRSYPEAQKSTGGVVQDFLRVLGIDLGFQPQANRHNQSLSGFGQDLLRILNVLREARFEVSEADYSCARRLVTEECLGASKRLPAEENEAYQERFAECNKEISNQWIENWCQQIEDRVVNQPQPSDTVEMHKFGGSSSDNQFVGGVIAKALGYH